MDDNKTDGAFGQVLLVLAAGVGVSVRLDARPHRPVRRRAFVAGDVESRWS